MAAILSRPQCVKHTSPKGRLCHYPQATGNCYTAQWKHTFFVRIIMQLQTEIWTFLANCMPQKARWIFLAWISTIEIWKYLHTLHGNDIRMFVTNSLWFQVILQVLCINNFLQSTMYLSLSYVECFTPERSHGHANQATETRIWRCILSNTHSV